MVRDRGGAVALLRASPARWPFVAQAFADAANAARNAARRAADATRIVIEFVGKPRDRVGLAAHPRRRVVERCFARIGRNRRLARDF